MAVTVRRGHPTRHRNARVELAGSERSRALRGLDATPLHGSPRSIVANLEAFLTDDARAEDFSHPLASTDFGVEKKFSLEGLDEKAVEKEIAAVLKARAEEERRRVYDVNPTDRLE